jgi:small subunit ribosomal protein S17
MTERKNRKTRTGFVVSDKMEKTRVVAVEDRFRHPFYKKFIKRTTKFMADDQKNESKVGDTVKIMETRPLSKNKNWRIIEILERAK